MLSWTYLAVISFATSAASGCTGAVATKLDHPGSPDVFDTSFGVAEAPSERAAPSPARTNGRFERPKVVVVRADWCGTCRHVEPVLLEALAGYSERVDVVTLDVTNEATTGAAERAAEAEGIADLFQRCGSRTPTILVAVSPDEVVRPVGPLLDPDTFREAFDAALATE